jgi:hypothetical protein
MVDMYHQCYQMKYISLSAVIERICKAMVNVLQERAASELGKKLR